MKLKIFAAFTAACVMAVGLYGQAVESEAVNLLGQDYFLSYTNNSTIADMSAYLIEKEGVLEVEETMAVGLWSAGEADMSKVVNNGDVNWLNLDTAGDVVTNALYAKEDMNYSIAENGKAVISATMLMVPSDEIEASFVDGYSTDGNFGFIDNGDLKFGLYAYEYDVTKTVTEGETTKEVVEVVTNLVIYHSYYDTPSVTDDDQLITPVAYTNYVYEVPSNTDFTQPQTVKITLMQAKTEELFFKVTLNETDVVTPYGCAEDTIVNCPDEIPFRDGGPWLRCVNNGNVNSISAINFSGTGTINGLTAGTIDANGGGGGEGGDDTEIVLSWNEFAGFADTTVGETATADVTFNLSNANEATVTIDDDSVFAIADQSTTLGTVTVTFKPTEAKEYTATLTVTAGDKTADLIITGTGVAAPAPTVISVVKLSGTSSKVNGTTPELTATLTDSNGNVIDAANYTIDTSAIDMTKAGLYPVVITVTGDIESVITNYYAVMNLTWFNGVPTQKALINPKNVRLTGAHYMHTSQDRAYLAVNGVNGDGNGEGHLLYSVDTLKSLYGTCQGVWEVAHNTAGGGKGIAANTASGIMIPGWGKKAYTDIVGTTTTFKGYDIADLDNISNTSNLVEETYTAEWAGSGYTEGQIMDGLDFNYAGTKVFGNDAGTDGPWVYQFAIDKNAKTMTWEHTYTTDFGRVRSVSSYYIDGKDYIFVGEGASSGRGEIAVIDPSNGSIKTICVAADDFTTDEFPSGRYFTNVKISGIASGEMYLYGSTDKGEVFVWALGHDAVTGEWMTAPVANITSAQAAALTSVGSIGNSRAFEVSDDNTAAFLYAQASPGQFAVVTDESLARRKALASATLSPTGSNKDVALGEITAAVIDENGDTVAASEYTISTNLIDITTVGEYTVTITPVEGSVYSNAVTAVYTISEASAAGFNYPEGGAIEDAALVAWLTGKAATQSQINDLGSAAALNEKYLLNIDLENSSYTLKIKSLAVGDDVKVEVELTRFNGETAVEAAINGKLQLWGTADLGVAFEDCGLTEITNADFSEGTTAVKSFIPETGVKFFKAVIVNPTAAE